MRKLRHFDWFTALLPKGISAFIGHDTQIFTKLIFFWLKCLSKLLHIESLATHALVEQAIFDAVLQVLWKFLFVKLLQLFRVLKFTQDILIYVLQ